VEWNIHTIAGRVIGLEISASWWHSCTLTTDQCSPLLAAYLHRIGRRDSTTCPHCNGADETAEHLVLHCPAHDQARWGMREKEKTEPKITLMWVNAVGENNTHARECWWAARRWSSKRSSTANRQQETPAARSNPALQAPDTPTAWRRTQSKASYKSL